MIRPKPLDHLLRYGFRSIEFYRKRVPRYYCKRTTLHILMLASAGLMVVMGGAGLASFVAIVTVIASSLTAWGEFNGFPKKLARYSSIINELTGFLLWWEHLTEVERNTTQRFQDLVHHVERAMSTEREGWLTTSQAAKMLAKQLSQEGNSSDTAGTAGNGQSKAAAMKGEAGKVLPVLR